ncbi:MAG TPA: insulinase family protein [Lachnospiraceae bacterium]|nr:insulinase family protein [Lachnospiraceae bacterium]
MRLEDLQAYEIMEKREITDLNSMSFLMKHKKTGARIALLSNDDNNKVFYIGFRTPPTDSTGVPHILEHSVLCGSKDFPVKDPFIELAKGSLNTFLNAMTYSDKTVYPIASCNDKDFQNLMHVYLDAVFYPNIYKEDKIFKQEGWHFEMESKESELTINGVVYNEMKGAFSSPDDVFEREIMNSLYPDTAYGVESGGDPDVIPELSYQQFLDFHGRYYHPSNSYIYLYGDMNMVEKLQWLDENYLSQFEELLIDSAIGIQPSFTKTKEIQKEYPISENESLEDNTYISYNTVVANSLDKELYVAFQILDYALCSAPGAPLKQALINKGIGKDVYSMFENGIIQPYFSVVAKNANANDKEIFIKTIEEVLNDICKKGIDKKSLQAGLNYFDFKYREADFGSYPKGLMYGLEALDSWLYDDTKPFLHIEANETFSILRQKIDTSYYEELIQKYLLDNTHKTIVMVTPVKGLSTKKDKELHKRLQSYKATLSAEEIETIVRETRELEEYQDEESSKEDLEKIPLLKRSDMTKEAEELINEERKEEDTVVLFHDVFTNGIGYIKLLFTINTVPAELFQYVGILKSVLGYIDTQHYSYGDLFNEINIQTGGISTGINTYTNALELKEYKATFEIKSKVLYENMDQAMNLMEEMILHSKLEDTKRLAEIIAELKSRVQASMTSAGHSLAAVRAMSYFSEVAMISEVINGIPFYRLLEELDSNFDSKKEELVKKLKELATFIFRPENLMVDITATQEGYDVLKPSIKKLKENLITTPVEKKILKLHPSILNEGFKTSAKIQYVCRAGNFVDKGLKYTGALKVLKVIMGYEYLWSNVRVKGGAYGCMSNFGKTGDSYFVSYRDPNLVKTVEIFEGAVSFLKNFKGDERTMTKYIIGAISDMDTPLTPVTKGARSLGAYMSNLLFSDIQKERDEILSVTPEMINGLASYIEAFLSDQCICVVGNEEAIEEHKNLFMSTDNLFH